MDADGRNVRKLTNAPDCYNGGPFFSPDGKRVIFRSDRKKKDHLQLYVINADGTGERALTDDATGSTGARTGTRTASTSSTRPPTIATRRPGRTTTCTG